MKKPKTTKNPIAYYVTPHGHGHSVRTCDVILKLHELCPELPIILRTTMSSDFFHTRLKGCTNYRIEPAEFDVGLVQLDSIRADLDASRRRLAELVRHRLAAIESESHWLRANDIALVAADIPAIPIAAAARAGAPSVAIGNFSWDWIYSEFAARDPRWEPIVAAFAEDYSKADLLIRLPFSGPMQAFPNQIDTGLLAQPGRNRRDEIAAALGADPARRWVLLCFSSIQLSDEAIERIGQLSDCEFLTMPALQHCAANMHRISGDRFPFGDLVASVDYVLSKPGYGIISDCIANSKPLIHAERSNFLEYEVLLTNIRRYLKNIPLSMDELYSGKLGRALDAIANAPEPTETLARDGAERIALILQSKSSGRQ